MSIADFRFVIADWVSQSIWGIGFQSEI